MSNVLAKPEEIKATLDAFERELNLGRTLDKLPIRAIDWNSHEGMQFLTKRCRSGKSEDIIRFLKLFRLTDKNGKLILAAAIPGGVPIEILPVESIINGKEQDRNALLKIIIEDGRWKAFLELLRADKTAHGAAKYDAYDYVVNELKRLGLARVPNSDVVFGKDINDEKEEENIRKRHITKEKMAFLTQQLNIEGINAIKTLWRMDNGLGILNYPDADDVKDYPDFIATLTKVINGAIEKDFQETYKCVRAFPLLYGGIMAASATDVIPDIIVKAFKKYPMMLQSIGRTFADADDREKRDYFFFARVAVTNPEFDWNDINLDRLPENGVTLYNEKDEPIVLSLREQLEEIIISACEAGIGGASIPREYATYHDADTSLLIILYDWIEKQRALEEKKKPVHEIAKKRSLFSRIFGS